MGNAHVYLLLSSGSSRSMSGEFREADRENDNPDNQCSESAMSRSAIFLAPEVQHG